MVRMLTAAVLALLAAAGPVGAQDALGSGRALDANLSTTGRANMETQDPDFRSRNLVVTGDVPAGRGFRGSVGYTAAGDFSGALGSDRFFSFRADSAWSAAPLIRFGRSVEQLRFGQSLATLPFRRDTAPSAPIDGAAAAAYPGQVETRLRLDRLISEAGTDAGFRAGAQPRAVGLIDAEEGPVLISASSLRGLEVQTYAAARPMTEGVPLYDVLSARERDSAAVPGAPFEPGVSRRLRDESGEPVEEIPAGPEDRVDARIGEGEGAYDQIIERIARRYVDVENVTWTARRDLLDRLDERLEDLRGELRGAPDAAVEPTPPTVAATPRVGEGAPGRRDVVDREVDEDDPDAERDGREMRDSRDAGVPIGTILRHGQRVERLATDDDGRFDELMRTAEDRLRAGEYFHAERRFIRALRFIPGHPMATAGLGHAQIGAGLHGSAALTLRSLFTHQPEMIDTVYDAALLPNPIRLAEAIDEIRARLGEERDRALHGFLLAYLGHQADDDALVAEGLDAMENATPEDPLLPVLREVWQGDGD